MKDPNKTFLSTSTCEDFGVQIGKSEATAENGERGMESSLRQERGIQTDSCMVESKEVQTEPGSKWQSFRKPFDQLKVTK